MWPSKLPSCEPFECCPPGKGVSTALVRLLQPVCACVFYLIIISSPFCVCCPSFWTILLSIFFYSFLLFLLFLFTVLTRANTLFVSMFFVYVFFPPPPSSSALDDDGVSAVVALVVPHY